MHAHKVSKIDVDVDLKQNLGIGQQIADIIMIDGYEFLFVTYEPADEVRYTFRTDLIDMDTGDVLWSDIKYGDGWNFYQKYHYYDPEDEAMMVEGKIASAHQQAFFGLDNSRTIDKIFGLD